MKKIISILLTLAMVLAVAAPVFASGFDYSVDVGAKEDMIGDSGAISKAGGSLVKIVGTIAIIIGVIMVIVAGMKYMMAPAGGKAEVKTTIMPILIGGVLVGAAGWLIPTIISWTQNNV